MKTTTSAELNSAEIQSILRARDNFTATFREEPPPPLTVAAVLPWITKVIMAGHDFRRAIADASWSAERRASPNSAHRMRTRVRVTPGQYDKLLDLDITDDEVAEFLKQRMEK